MADTRHNKENRDPRRYDDIIDLDRPVSTTHPPMDPKLRAAQFAPFAALTGHAAAIEEARLEHIAAGDGVEAIPVWEAEAAGDYLQET